jgi:hypothetical protein
VNCVLQQFFLKKFLSWEKNVYNTRIYINLFMFSLCWNPVPCISGMHSDALWFIIKIKLPPYSSSSKRYLSYEFSTSILYITLNLQKLLQRFPQLSPFNLVSLLIHCLLTNSMEKCSSWEANRSSGSQEIPLISCNPKVHYRVNTSLLPAPILSHIDPVPAPHSTYLRFISILYFYLWLGLPSELFPPGFPTKVPLLSTHSK